VLPELLYPFIDLLNQRKHRPSDSLTLYRLKRHMGFARQLDINRIPGPDFASRRYDTHHTRLADQVSIFITIQYGRKKSLLEVVQLCARISQAGDRDHRRAAQMKACPLGQGKQVKTFGRYVFAQVTRQYLETAPLQFLEQFGMNQVNLAEIRLRRVFRDTGAMLDSHAGMGVPFHADPGDQLDAGLHLLAE
jgi:hypothetical protein